MCNAAAKHRRMSRLVMLRKVALLDPHPESHQHQNSVSFRGSSLPMPTKFGRHLSLCSGVNLWTDSKLGPVSTWVGDRLWMG